MPSVLPTEMVVEVAKTIWQLSHNLLLLKTSKISETDFTKVYVLPGGNRELRNSEHQLPNGH